MGLNDQLISNQITCHCGSQSPLSESWDTVQEWWRRHGFGQKCGGGGGREVKRSEREEIVLR